MRGASGGPGAWSGSGPFSSWSWARPSLSPFTRSAPTKVREAAPAPLQQRYLLYTAVLKQVRKSRLYNFCGRKLMLSTYITFFLSLPFFSLHESISAVLWIQLHGSWIRILNVCPIWSRIQGYVIKY